MHVPALALVAGLAVVAWSDAATACECSPPSSDEARASAQLVLEGTVTADVGTQMRELTLHDVKIHRGPAQGPAMTFENGSDCSPFQFETGERYLIYVNGEDLRVTVCDRVVKAAGAGAEIAALAPGEEPTPPATAPADGEPAPSDPAPEVRHGRGGGCVSCTVAARDAGPNGVAGALLAVLLGALGVRRASGSFRRPPRS